MALLVTACWGDAHTPEPEVLVPVLGLVVVPVRGAQVLGRVVERPAAHHPPPGLSRLPRGYCATSCLACQVPLQAFLPAPELAPDVVGQGQREVSLTFGQPGRFYSEPQPQTQTQENQVSVLQGSSAIDIFQRQGHGVEQAQCLNGQLACQDVLR